MYILCIKLDITGHKYSQLSTLTIPTSHEDDESLVEIPPAFPLPIF